MEAERTPAGLIVPKGTQELKREVWAEDEAKVMRKMFSVMQPHHINVMLRCSMCQQFVMFQSGPGGVEGVCHCTRRELI
jgi:hypothetical protein